MHIGPRAGEEVLEELEVSALDARCTACRHRAHSFEGVDLVEILNRDILVRGFTDLTMFEPSYLTIIDTGSSLNDFS